ncbi:RINT-1 family protein [Microdochium bolleyi]|uniref:RINT-1 family protein n=1 Tax=Microdochium bolleyi TaxID=196109 RepID=A0A136IYZ8_9PEZI|nr:RINT-1 family protein [Microdochium bolleyi]
MAVPTLFRSPTAEPDIRLEDYLDDKLQSTADLDTLDSLIANVEVQRSQLQAQLDDATKELESARRAGHDRQGGLQKSIQEFEELQQSIDSRIGAVANSHAPDEAIRRLEKPMNQLHKVELAYRYVSLLQDVENLRNEARSHLPQDPKAALQPYTRLKKLGSRLEELREQADEAAAHLVGYVKGISESLWTEMKSIMAKEMESLLTKRGWYTGGVDPRSEMDDEWLECFEKLVDLQMPEVLYSDTAVPLLPFEVMVKPFVQWFRFQFMSDNPTSSPQNFGTFCVSQFLSLLEKWEDFFRENVSYILASRYGETRVKDMSVYRDPACALIAAMLPVVREKISTVVQHGLRNPQFFSSMINQLLDLDDELRSRFDYDGGDPVRGWGGLTSEVLDKYFDFWLTAEKEFALERFQAILSSADARNIDYDYSGSGKMKPTFAAVRIADLLKSVTSQYDRIRRFSHKLRFLIDIQLEILDRYHDRLRDSLEAYSAITSTLGRTLHGVTKEQLAALEGTGTLETLCKVLSSADHIITTLEIWSNEEFFVTLWDKLQARATTVGDEDDLAGGLSYEQVKGRTSSSVGLDGDGGILFDETITSYRNRRKAAEAFLVSALVSSHQKAFRAYLSKTEWSIVSGDSDDTAILSITLELDEPLRTMKQNFEFLQPALSTTVFRRLLRESLTRLSDLLWENVLMRYTFTMLGAAQFARDLEAITSLIDRFIPDGSSALSAILEGASVLNLPLEPVDGALGLQQASDRFFKDNTEAKAALEEMGVESLTPAHARQIVQKRAENQT